MVDLVDLDTGDTTGETSVDTGTTEDTGVTSVDTEGSTELTGVTGVTVVEDESTVTRSPGVSVIPGPISESCALTTTSEVDVLLITEPLTKETEESGAVRKGCVRVGHVVTLRY